MNEQLFVEIDEPIHCKLHKNISYVLNLLIGYMCWKLCLCCLHRLFEQLYCAITSLWSGDSNI